MKLKNEKKIQFFSHAAGFEPGTSGLPRPTKWLPKNWTISDIVSFVLMLEGYFWSLNVRTSLLYWNLSEKYNFFDILTRFCIIIHKNSNSEKNVRPYYLKYPSLPHNEIYLKWKVTKWSLFFEIGNPQPPPAKSQSLKNLIFTK